MCSSDVITHSKYVGYANLILDIFIIVQLFYRFIGTCVLYFLISFLCIVLESLQF